MRAPLFGMIVGLAVSGCIAGEPDPSSLGTDFDALDASADDGQLATEAEGADGSPVTLALAIDPFSSASCQGAPMTDAQAASHFAPGKTTATLGSYRIRMRKRDCNRVTGCGRWRAYNDDDTFDNPVGIEGVWTTPAKALTGSAILTVGADVRFGLKPKGLCTFPDSRGTMTSSWDVSQPITVGTLPDGTGYQQNLDLYSWAGPRDYFPLGTCTLVPTTMGRNFYGANALALHGIVTEHCARFAAATTTKNPWTDMPDPWIEYQAAVVAKY